MRIITALFVVLAFSGCIRFTKQDLTEYTYNNEKVTMGMTTMQVRKILGEPTHISLPDPEDQTVSPDHIYEAMIEGQEYWHYHSIYKGDKEQLDITFSDGVVIKMRDFIVAD